jgi:hypothetical protein
MQPRDGQRVSYIGLGEAGLSLGDKGTVVSADVSGSHVNWTTGQRVGSICLVNNDDLAPFSAARTSIQDELADSLAYGSLVSIAVRDVFDAEGESGLITAMNEEGHLASLSYIAEDAITSVAAQIRNSPSFGAVLGQLEPDEADALVAAAAVSLLRDALGE